METRIKIICFDVDGILVPGNSWLKLTKALGCSPQIHADIFKQAKEGKISFEEGQRMLEKMYQNTGGANKSQMVKIFESFKIRKEAFPIMRYLKKKGYILGIISGSMDLYVEIVAKKLGIKNFYANTKLLWDREGKLKGWKYYKNQEAKKVEQLKEFAKKKGIDLKECAFVGDSENDIGVFKLTRHGIAINCDIKELEKVAWRVVDSLSDLREIF